MTQSTFAEVRKKVSPAVVHQDMDHRAVQCIPDHEQLLIETTALGAHSNQTGKDFSQLHTDTSLPSSPRQNQIANCPVFPQRCPFGGACHTCPPRVQAKLKISQPGDKYEREADQIAERVISMSEPSLQYQTLDGNNFNSIPLYGDEVSHLPDRMLGTTPCSSLDSQFSLNFSGKGGLPLDGSIQEFMEDRFGGYEFNQVRIHNNSQAAESANSLNARAFTVGNDIAFAHGQFSPLTMAGRHLLAHELTHVVQQNTKGTYTIQRKQADQSTQRKSLLHPLLYWAFEPNTKQIYVIPKEGVTLTDIANFLYGATTAVIKFARINGIKVGEALKTGLYLRLTGEKLSVAAFQSMKKSEKQKTHIPLGTVEPQKFLRTKRILDQQVERDFNLIVSKLNEIHYSDADEGQVIATLRKWGMEKFTTRPDLYPQGGEYLDNLLKKLLFKSKKVGMSYYSTIFNKFDRVEEVRRIRDRYSRYFKGEEGVKEVSITEDFETGKWKETTKKFWTDQFTRLGGYLKRIGVPRIIQNLLGGIVGAIQAFGEILYELGEGIWTLVVALDHVKASILYFITGAIEGAGIGFLKRIPYVGKVFNPQTYYSKYQKTTNFINSMRGALKDPGRIWRGIKEAAGRAWEQVLDEYNKADEFNKSRIIARGVVKVGMAIGGFIKNLPQLAKSTAKIAKTVATVAIKSAKVIAKGIAGAYRTAKGVIKGFWRVVQTTFENGQKRLKYFFKKRGDKGEIDIPPKEAEKYIKCSTCKLVTKNDMLKIRGGQKRLSLKDIMEWEGGNKGHTLERHGFQHTKDTLRSRLTGVEEIPGPPQGAKDFRIWKGHKGHAAAKWADHETMADAISDVINKNITSIEQSIQKGEQFYLPRVTLNRHLGSGWVTTVGPSKGVFWRESLENLRLRIFPDGEGGWYVKTAFPVP